jgi:hypothetical protein
MPAGIGASGYLALTFETSPGTYLPPTTAGTIFVPIISESLVYTEAKYYSQAIRQQTIDNDAKNSYYHVEGNVTYEVDSKFEPYWLYISRMTPSKTGAGPYTYTFTPASTGSAPIAGDTVTGATNRRTASITVIRNGVGFGYAGCTVGNHAYTIDNGVLRHSMDIMGLSEAQPGALGSPAWQTPVLYGADSHAIYVDTAGLTPAFATPSVSFDGFTLNINDNPAPQNRIKNDRAAAYISYGFTDLTIDTSLDFLSRTEYDNFKAVTKRAIKLESVPAAGTFAGATVDAMQFIVYNSVYDTYTVGLGAAPDLVMAATSMRGLAIAGGTAYSIGVKSAATIT